jgi:hypothetical protein
LTELQLRSQMAEYLTDLPAMLDEAGHYVALSRLSASGLSQQDIMCARQHTQSMREFKASVEWWYKERLSARFGDGSYMEIAEHMATRTGDGTRLPLLPTVLHCVINDVLAHLTKILLALGFLTEKKQTNWAQQLEEYQRRQAATVAAFYCVKAKSAVGTKMLSFGLQQLSFKSSQFDDVILAQLPTFCDLDIKYDRGETESDLSACATM